METASESSPFVEACREVFGPWTERFGLVEADVNTSPALPWFKMASAGARVTVGADVREWNPLYFWLEPARSPGFDPTLVGQDPVQARWPYFDLEQVLAVRGVRPKPRHLTKIRKLDNPRELREVFGRLRHYAEEYAADLLAGDALAFEALEPLLKARYG
ncbi:MAG: hypothetical protein KY443_02105 [Actinobacteria bacterium]|nr:hypothetical protein [Actinomycetota bacterium]